MICVWLESAMKTTSENVRFPLESTMRTPPQIWQTSLDSATKTQPKVVHISLESAMQTQTQVVQISLGANAKAQAICFALCFAIGLIAGVFALLYFKKSRFFERALTDFFATCAIGLGLFCCIEFFMQGYAALYGICAYFLGVCTLPFLFCKLQKFRQNRLQNRLQNRTEKHAKSHRKTHEKRRENPAKSIKI